MKKFFEYQLKNIVDHCDWGETYLPCYNFNKEFSDDFKIIKSFYKRCLAGKVDGFNRAKPLIGYEQYINMIKETYTDPVVQENIRDWCRDPDYQFLVDHVSYDWIILNPYMPEFCQQLCDKMNVFYKDSQIILQVQQPGYISPLHIDARKHLKRATDQSKFNNKQNADYDRWIMFFDDWITGHVFQMGTEFIKWKAGDVFHWNVRDVPHALANIGYYLRFLILIKAVKNPA